jgi:hypothetical protein
MKYDIITLLYVMMAYETDRITLLYAKTIYETYSITLLYAIMIYEREERRGDNRRRFWMALQIGWERGQSRK